MNHSDMNTSSANMNTSSANMNTSSANMNTSSANMNTSSNNNTNELCIPSSPNGIQTSRLPKVLPLTRLPKINPGALARLQQNAAGPRSVPRIEPGAGLGSILGTDLGLPPHILKHPPRFLPEPVENYSWRPSGTYQDANSGRTWYLPNHRSFSDWVNQTFIKYFDSSYQDKEDVVVKKPLFPYQKFISKVFSPSCPLRGILINHDMGSGKSRTGIETAENFRLAGYNMVTLLPASLRDNMIGEVRKWGRSDLSYPEGFDLMPADKQLQITNELNRRIRASYHFVSYNSSRVVQELSKIVTDNTCIMIDEIHDLINMMTSETGKVGRRIYDILMKARNLRVIGLTGTINPINYPFELGLLLNIIRGPIPIWGTGEKSGRITGWTTAFPDNRIDFDDLFVDYETKTLRNIDMFKRRATGLVSYFHGARKDLYPEVIKLDIERVVMDDVQFNGYWKARTEEIVRESRSGSGKRVAPNTFRPNSRQYCNYALPPGVNRPMSLGKYKRLIFDNPALNPFEKLWTEAQLVELRDLFLRMLGLKDNLKGSLTPTQSLQLSKQDQKFRSKWASYKDPKARLTFLVETLQKVGMIGKYRHIITSNEEVAILEPNENRNGVEIALAELSGPFKQYLDPAQDLGKCSQKYLRMIKNITEGPGSDGPAFVFSNFRTLEGVEIFSRVLGKMGWVCYSEGDDLTEPKSRYAIVSGTESQDLRTRIIEYYNHPRNKNGEYLKLILGTSSSAQGLSLMNCRQVHIMEPWWTLILILQVIGRARRIRSHHGLPKHLRKVYVFQYHSVLSESQKKQIGSAAEHQTTDEYLYEKAVEKDAINQQCYDLVKSIAIDFTLSARENKPLEKGLAPTPIRRQVQDYTYMPSIAQEACHLDEVKSNLQNRNTPNMLTNSTYEIVKKTYRYKPIKVGKESFAILLDKHNRPTRRMVLWGNGLKSHRDQAIPLYDYRSVKFGGTLVLRAYVDSKGQRRDPGEGQIVD